jgi:hypothetical protein
MSQTFQTLRTCITHLLPPTRPVRLTGMTIEPEYVLLQVTTTAPAARCPRCAVPSSTVHSRYQRHLTDLPWGTRPVRLQLTVRKFICRNLSCPRRIFTERVPEEALDQVFSTHGKALKAVSEALSHTPVGPTRWPDGRPGPPEYPDAAGPDTGGAASVATARPL